MTRSALAPALSRAALAIAAVLSMSALGGWAGAAMAQEAEADAAADAQPMVEMVQGDADAPVTIIEYASFTCPHCAAFHADTYPDLQEAYIDTGLVRFVYREVYFDRYGLWAGMVARCAGPERYFGLVGLIYEQQSDWVSNDPAETASSLRRLGRQAGLSNEQLDVCLSDGDTAEALYAAYQSHMEDHAITGTPTLVIDGELYSGNRSFEDVETLIAPLLPEGSVPEEES